MPDTQPSPPAPQPGTFSAFDRSFYMTDGYEGYLDRFAAIAEEQVIGALLGTTAPSPSTTFLDVGCGMGGVVLALRNRGYEAFGTEVSTFCLEHSPVREWMRFGDVCSLPFPDKSFDIVSCIDTFQYLTREQMEQAAGELTRLAKRFILFETIDAASHNARQDYNPDPLRVAACTQLTGDDYIHLFQQHGCSCVHTNLLAGDFDFSALFATPSCV
jgi:SAM-dependent methyltransferase